jgi:hypothetical protein
MVVREHVDTAVPTVFKLVRLKTHPREQVPDEKLELLGSEVEQG